MQYLYCWSKSDLAKIDQIENETGKQSQIKTNKKPADLNLNWLKFVKFKRWKIILNIKQKQNNLISKTKSGKQSLSCRSLPRWIFWPCLRCPAGPGSPHDCHLIIIIIIMTMMKMMMMMMMMVIAQQAQVVHTTVIWSC